MKRIGIVTPWGLHNYGNRLQNYAVHRLLEDRGYRPYTFVLSSNFVMGNLGAIKRFTRAQLLRRDSSAQRIRRFLTFEGAMRHRRFWSERELHRTRDTFACFVAGSDQIWNPHHVNLAGSQFLDWAYEYQRIALAPSFGVSEIPYEWKSKYAKWLSGFAELSVREDAGAAIIKELTGQDAQVLIDPTLMLEPSRWRDRASDSLRPARPYALTYFLGSLTPERTAYIQQTAHAHHLDLISLREKPDQGKRQSGPSEFLDLVDHAGCVFTDSFHGSAFAMLFDVPVVIFEREDEHANMSSRLDTFLRTFGLQGRLYSEASPPVITNVDYSGSLKVLTQKRAEFHSYLDTQLARVAAEAHARVRAT